MRTYAVAASRSDVEFLTGSGFDAILVSFEYDRNGVILGGLAPDTHVMLDSGAFTAWTTGRPAADVDVYAAYARRQRDSFSDAVVINLDVIPGTAADPLVTDHERATAVKASAENAERLRSADLPVMEVFHLDEPLSVLDAILGRLRPGERIGFGGLARQTGGRGFRVKHRFCTAAFRHLLALTGKHDFPPVHGLGVAPDGPIGGLAFPWASVDCTSWCSIGRFGVRVTRDGKRLGGRSDPRVRGQRDLTELYKKRVLDGWQRQDETYTRLWDSRGVKVAA